MRISLHAIFKWSLCLTVYLPRKKPGTHTNLLYSHACSIPFLMPSTPTHAEASDSSSLPSFNHYDVISFTRLDFCKLWARRRARLQLIRDLLELHKETAARFPAQRSSCTSTTHLATATNPASLSKLTSVIRLPQPVKTDTCAHSSSCKPINSILSSSLEIQHG